MDRIQLISSEQDLPTERAESSHSSLACIATTWAFAGVIHVFTFTWLSPNYWQGILYLTATAMLVLRPASLLRFAFFLLATSLALFSNYHVLANHLVLEFWVSLALLAGILISLSPFRKDRSPPDTWLERLAPLVRLHYLLLYGFAFFSKLNTDFLHPQSSCAVVFAIRTLEALHVGSFPLGQALIESDFLAYSAIYSTLTIELSIPLLLVFRRTRHLGIVVALIFHMVMGLVPILGISSFSALSLALLLFFYPKQALRNLHNRFTKLIPHRFRTPKRILIIRIACIICFIATLLPYHRYLHPSPILVTAIWLPVSLVFLYHSIKALKTSDSVNPSKPDNPSNYFIPKPVPMFVFVIPALIIGSLPYLGLQTQGSFTMFSNLRILGKQANHIVLPAAPLREANELIRIIGSNHPLLSEYPENDKLITTHELRRKTKQTSSDYYILCEFRDGLILIGRFQGVLTSHPLLEASPTFPYDLLSFREVSTQERCECSW